jgi:hypothetical protein
VNGGSLTETGKTRREEKLKKMNGSILNMVSLRYFSDMCEKILGGHLE